MLTAPAATFAYGVFDDTEPASNAARRAIGLALWVSASALAAPAVKILPIGDSITQGGHLRSEYTYRLPLRELLQDEGVQADFIGTRTAGLDPGFRWPASFDPHHEGYYGQKTRDVVRQVEAHLPALPAPDIALVHLGTNDSGWRCGIDVIEPLKALIGELRRQNARVVVLVALPANSVRGGGTLLRWELRLMAHDASTRASPVVAVDQSSALQSRATFDGVHPSPDGQRLMAGSWLQAMQRFLPDRKQANAESIAGGAGEASVLSARAGAGTRPSPQSP